MSNEQHQKTDSWQRALGDARRIEGTRRRPRPGPGRHRPDTQRDDAWQRALTGPPITEFRRVS
jgi:hypothetical protein